MLRVIPQRVNQYCWEEGLPKGGRDRFYIPDVVNWRKVKQIAELADVSVKSLESLGLVDCSLGSEDMH